MDNFSAGKLLLNVVNEMLEGFQIVDRDFRYLYVNDAAIKQGKAARETLIGKTMMECYPGIDKTPLFEELKRCMAVGVDVRMDNEFTYPDGSVGWFQLYLHPILEGILIMSIDVTEQKLAERALREKVSELHKLSNLTVGREARMLEMRRLVEDLKNFVRPPNPVQVLLRNDR